jgi:hypothetical protein
MFPEYLGTEAVLAALRVDVQVAGDVERNVPVPAVRLVHVQPLALKNIQSNRGTFKERSVINR